MEFIEHLSDRLGKAVSWLTSIMVIVMTLIVVLRYGFNIGWISLQESVLYLHAAVLMLGMSYVLKHDQHVRVDIFYNRYSPEKQDVINILGHLVLLIPTCVFIIYMSFNYVAQSWQFLEGSQEAGGLPFVYLLKSLIIVMPCLLILQAISNIFIRVSRLKLTRVKSRPNKGAN